MSDYVPSIDEIFRITTIDKKRKVKMSISLKDTDGDEISLKETIEKITEYADDQIASEAENATKQQIMPLMAQAVAIGLAKILGPEHTSLLLAQEDIRYSVVHMMTVSFLLLKWIQGKNIKIHTLEEPITEEDIQTLERVSKASNILTLASAAGLNGKELLQKLVEEGKLTEEDLVNFGVKSDKETKQAN